MKAQVSVVPRRVDLRAWETKLRNVAQHATVPKALGDMIQDLVLQVRAACVAHLAAKHMDTAVDLLEGFEVYRR